MINTLSVNAAKKLIEFIDKTNYQLAPHGDGLFSSKQEALTFVTGDSYAPEEPLNVCFDTAQGNYWQSAEVFFENDNWTIEDRGMGGMSSSGESIGSALVSFRAKHDSTDEYYPVELALNEKTKLIIENLITTEKEHLSKLDADYSYMGNNDELNTANSVCQNLCELYGFDIAEDIEWSSNAISATSKEICECHLTRLEELQSGNLKSL
ncbi:MAG: hypothetical protein ACI87J_002118 [Colwellia sp.]|jgi:hypothetical protein